MNRPALIVMAGLIMPAVIRAGDKGASESSRSLARVEAPDLSNRQNDDVNQA